MQLEVIPTRRPSGTSHPPTSRKPICPSGHFRSHGHLNLTSQPSSIASKQHDRICAVFGVGVKLWLVASSPHRPPAVRSIHARIPPGCPYRTRYARMAARSNPLSGPSLGQVSEAAVEPSGLCRSRRPPRERALELTHPPLRPVYDVCAARRDKCRRPR